MSFFSIIFHSCLNLSIDGQRSITYFRKVFALDCQPRTVVLDRAKPSMQRGESSLKLWRIEEVFVGEHVPFFFVSRPHSPERV